ncbi:hypothetical protein BgiBS90_012999, partial [Biomphalaria glabrata]
TTTKRKTHRPNQRPRTIFLWVKCLAKQTREFLAQTQRIINVMLKDSDAVVC